MPIDKDESIKKRERAWLDRVFDDAEASCFYGSVEVKFQNGRIVRVYRHSSHCPPSRPQKDLE